MQIRTLQSGVGRSRFGALIILLILATATHATVSPCTATDGTTTHSDQPCETHAQAVQEAALSQATAHHHDDIVRLLLIHVPTPSVPDMNMVAMRRDLEAMRLIRRHDELVHDIRPSMKDQALRFTILGGRDGLEDRKQMIERLLADGADIDNHPTGVDVIPVMLAPTAEMTEFLFDQGANKNAQMTGVQLACWFVCNNSGGDPLRTLQVLVDRGIDIGGGRSNSSPSSAPPPSTTTVTQAAQFFPKRGCVQLGAIDNSHSPMELHSSFNDCLQNNCDADAVSLFVLAGMDGSFDTARFETAMKAQMNDPSRHAILCEQIKKIGPPQYFPAYMVNHGLGVMQSALANCVR